MKKYLIPILFLIQSAALVAGDFYDVIGLSCTNYVESLTTNTVDNTAYYFKPGEFPKSGRIYLRANGSAATTNGLITVYLSTCSVSNQFNDMVYIPPSPITLTATNWVRYDLGVLTNTVGSAAIDLSGVRGMKVGAIRNGTLGPLTNINVNVSVWGVR